MLIVPGSGPVDRDGNAVAIGLHTNCYRLLAEDVAALAADRSGNLATYGDPALPLAPGLHPVLAEFLVNQGVALTGAFR